MSQSKPPFYSRIRKETSEKIIHDEPVFEKEISVGLKDLIYHLLDKNVWI